MYRRTLWATLCSKLGILQRINGSFAVFLHPANLPSFESWYRMRRAQTLRRLRRFKTVGVYRDVLTAANLFISYLWDWVDIVSKKCTVGLFRGRQRVFYWLLWGCAGNWIKVRAQNQSYNTNHDNTGPFSKRPITGLAWLLIYQNLFYLPVLRQICRFRPTS